ncbi:hypothetical protein V6N13_010928 [Hibiscus sabdariffa]|uniref:Uncharacterized protein n=1 Tax=Hibiscus sabdariffa TaxID=183260 RepID=A0ABR2SAT8_9ROSI
MSCMDQLQQSAITATFNNGDRESQQVLSSGHKRGGWVTFFFVSATLSGLMIAGWGWLTNLIVFLIEEFNVKSIDATQVANVVNGSINLVLIIGAVLADSFLGSFHVVSISSLLSLLGIIVITLTATLSYLRPHCETGSSLCHGPSKLHLAVLYSGITLASIGLGVVRFTLATLGANQFDNPTDQGSFFNWFFFTFYVACVVSSIGIVYVEDNISWGVGFGICAAFNFLGWLIFLLGNRFYRHDKPQGSPYTSLARVIVAAIRKRKVPVSSESKDYYHEINDGDDKNTTATTPKRSFGFLNHAAVKTEGDINSDGSIAKPWRLCSVQQVEDLKSLIRILPLWASTVFLATPIAIQNNMTVLQALAMDPHLGPNFKIPAGSITIVVLISSAAFIALLDRVLYPNWKRLTGRSLTPLQKVGTGHVFNILSMAISAVVESKRLKIAHDNHLQGQPGGNAAVVPMLALWLFPQLIVVGIGEAFHFPGNVSLYYQEFPVSMKSTATSMISIVIGVAFYVSATVVDLIRNVTGWLPDDINEGRLDKVYWIFVLLGLLNFSYFLLCAKFYGYQNLQQ